MGRTLRALALSLGRSPHHYEQKQDARKDHERQDESDDHVPRLRDVSFRRRLRMVFGDGPRDPVPEWLLRDILGPVLADLQRPTLVEFDISVVESGFGPLVWFQERGVVGGTGQQIPDGGRRTAELLVEWADWLQDQVFPETAGAWGQARPVCAGHPHPATPVELDGEAWWVCPTDGRRVGRIGQLG